MMDRFDLSDVDAQLALRVEIRDLKVAQVRAKLSIARLRRALPTGRAYIRRALRLDAWGLRKIEGR